MVVHFTQLPPGERHALPTDRWEAKCARRLMRARWFAFLWCIALMGTHPTHGVITEASDVPLEATGDRASFFFTDPDVSLISGPSHWSTRAARAWFGDEERDALHDGMTQRLVPDVLIDHRLEKFAEEFQCSDLNLPSSDLIGPEQIDKISSNDAPHDWCAERSVADFTRTSAEEIPAGNMIFVLVRECLEWEMRNMLQERSARHWSECFDLLPQVCQAPENLPLGAPTMHELLCMTSRSCVVPVSLQSLSDGSDATDLATVPAHEPFLEVLHHDALKSARSSGASRSTALILLIMAVLLFLGFLRYQHGHAQRG